MKDRDTALGPVIGLALVLLLLRIVAGACATAPTGAPGLVASPTSGA